MSSEEVSAEPRCIDLTSYRPADRKWKVAALYVLIAIATGLGLELLYVSVAYSHALWSSSLSTQKGELLLLSIGVGLVMIGVWVDVMPKLLAGAVEITVDDSGVYLRYPRGNTESYRWKGTKSKFLLLDYSMYPKTIGFGDGYVLNGGSRWSRRSLLSQQAFELTLAKAKESGAFIRTHRGSEILYGVSPTIHRIQCRGRS